MECAKPVSECNLEPSHLPAGSALHSLQHSSEDQFPHRPESRCEAGGIQPDSALQQASAIVPANAKRIAIAGTLAVRRPAVSIEPAPIWLKALRDPTVPIGAESTAADGLLNSDGKQQLRTAAEERGAARYDHGKDGIAAEVLQLGERLTWRNWSGL